MRRLSHQCPCSLRATAEALHYAYGEVWESNSGESDRISPTQPQTYQGKEYSAQTGDFDFGPRRYIPSALIRRAPDLKARDYPHISPYTFCASNPIRYADPSGMEFTDAAKEYVEALQSASLTSMFDALKKQRFDLVYQFNETLVEIKKMAESEIVFDVKLWSKNDLGKTIYHVAKTSDDSDAVVFVFPKVAYFGLIAHEFKHGYQFINSDIDLMTDNFDRRPWPILADHFDELEAYKRSHLFGDVPTSMIEIQNRYSNIHPIKRSIGNIKKSEVQKILNGHHKYAVYFNGKVYYEKNQINTYHD